RSSYPAGVCFLVELKGLLYLVDSPEDESSMYIWVLKDSKNYVCAKEYNIDLRMFYLGLDFITPLDYREEKILMDAKFGSLEWYDVEKKCFKRIDNLTSGQWKWSVLYTDGLFSLGSRYLGPYNVFRCCLRTANSDGYETDVLLRNQTTTVAVAMTATEIGDGRRRWLSRHSEVSDSANRNEFFGLFLKTFDFATKMQ
ncbi:hypothetical protein H5410_035637, partial [Solanum commersonii]